MNREKFDEYIRRFNEKDMTAFEDFLTDDMKMQNGGLHYQGIQGMKDHYSLIWSNMSEKLNVKDFVSNGDRLSIEMEAVFDVLSDASDSPFGPITKGEQFIFNGLIMYHLRDERFCQIKLAYFDFVRVTTEGERISLGIAH